MVVSSSEPSRPFAANRSDSAVKPEMSADTIDPCRVWCAVPFGQRNSSCGTYGASGSVRSAGGWVSGSGSVVVFGGAAIVHDSVPTACYTSASAGLAVPLAMSSSAARTTGTIWSLPSSRPVELRSATSRTTVAR